MKEWFCLKEKDYFYIDPQEDAPVYFGRQELHQRLMMTLRNSFMTKAGVPKILVWGPWGGGKTHTLFHIKYFLEHDAEVPPCEVIYFDLGPLASRSTYARLHRMFMETLGMETVRGLANDLLSSMVGPDLEDRLRRYFPNSNIGNALRSLSYGGSAPQSLMAWKWLCGENLRDDQQRTLPVTKNLTGEGELIEVTLAIAKLMRDIRNRRIIYLVDEAEQLNSVTNPDAERTFIWSIRQLADETVNRVTGFVFAATGRHGEELPSILQRDEIRSRIRDPNIIPIEHFGGVQDIRNFVVELLQDLVDRERAEQEIQKHGLPATPETYPFTEDALDQLCEFLGEPGETGELRSLPREIIGSINDCAVRSYRAGERVIDVHQIEAQRVE